MPVKITDCSENYRAQRDLILIYKSDAYNNVKGYLTKLVEILWKLGYYEDNESLFSRENNL